MIASDFNGKIERWHKNLKGDCIRVQVPLSLDDARRLVADYIAHDYPLAPEQGRGTRSSSSR